MSITKQLQWKQDSNSGTYVCDDELTLCEEIVRKCLKLSKRAQLPEDIQATLSIKAPKVKGSVKLIIRPWINNFTRESWEYARGHIAAQDIGMYSHAMNIIKDLCRMEGLSTQSIQIMWLTVRPIA
jgi:hypothetical protein